MNTPETSAPAKVPSAPIVHSMGRDNTSRSTERQPTPILFASAGTASSPQATRQAAPMADSPAGTHSTRSAKDESIPNPRALAGFTNSLDDQRLRGTQSRLVVGGKTSPQAIQRATPIVGAPAGVTPTAAAKAVSKPKDQVSLPYQTSQAAPGKVDTHMVHGGLALSFPGDHSMPDAHMRNVAGDTTQPTAMKQTTPNQQPLSAVTPPRTAMHEVTPMGLALPGDQLPREARDGSTPKDASPLAGQTPLPANGSAAPSSAPLGVDEAGKPAPAIRHSEPMARTPELADPLLALAADVLDDLESVWIANTNRLRQLTRDVEDSDGEERGFGLTLDHPDVARLAALVDALDKAQQDATKNLTKRLKQHPLAPWLKAQKGVGDKQAARLLASIGDPYWNFLHDRPRTVSELWAYCGYHVLRVGAQTTLNAHSAHGSDPAPSSPAGQPALDAHKGVASGGKTGHPDQVMVVNQAVDVGVAPKRARGAKANWSSTAKMRTYLVAESCMKQLRKPCEKNPDLGYAIHVDGCQCSPYRVIYDATRAKYADATHAVECARCGPKGKPALAGSPLSDAHKMARALRAVSKELLKELWREARRIHHLNNEPTEESQ